MEHVKENLEFIMENPNTTTLEKFLHLKNLLGMMTGEINITPSLYKKTPEEDEEEAYRDLKNQKDEFNNHIWSRLGMLKRAQASGYDLKDSPEGLSFYKREIPREEPESQRQRTYADDLVAKKYIRRMQAIRGAEALGLSPSLNPNTGILGFVKKTPTEQPNVSVKQEPTEYDNWVQQRYRQQRGLASELDTPNMSNIRDLLARGELNFPGDESPKPIRNIYRATQTPDVTVSSISIPKKSSPFLYKTQYTEPTSFGNKSSPATIVGYSPDDDFSMDYPTSHQKNVIPNVTTITREIPSPKNYNQAYTYNPEYIKLGVSGNISKPTDIEPEAEYNKDDIIKQMSFIKGAEAEGRVPSTKNIIPGTLVFSKREQQPPQSDTPIKPPSWKAKKIIKDIMANRVISKEMENAKAEITRRVLGTQETPKQRKITPVTDNGYDSQSLLKQISAEKGTEMDYPETITPEKKSPKQTNTKMSKMGSVSSGRTTASGNPVFRKKVK